MDYLLAAKDVCAKANLKIIARRNGAGQVCSYKLFRGTQPRLTFVGERVEAQALYELAKRCARNTGSGK